MASFLVRDLNRFPSTVLDMHWRRSPFQPGFRTTRFIAPIGRSFGPDCVFVCVGICHSFGCSPISLTAGCRGAASQLAGGSSVCLVPALLSLAACHFPFHPAPAHLFLRPPPFWTALTLLVGLPRGLPSPSRFHSGPQVVETPGFFGSGRIVVFPSSSGGCHFGSVSGPSTSFCVFSVRGCAFVSVSTCGLVLFLGSALPRRSPALLVAILLRAFPME